MKIITGSGRSGTSFVAKIIDEIHGLEGEFVWEKNVRAGMENKAVVSLNKFLFECNGRNRPYSNQWLSQYEIAYAKQVIKDGDLVSSLSDIDWAKDPLFSKTLKIWLDAGLNVEHLIVCTRNPNDSMASAKRTDRGFEPAHGYTEDEIEIEMNARQGYLWDVILRYGIPFSVVRYEHMLQDFPLILAQLFPEKTRVEYQEMITKTWNPSI